MLYGLRCLRLRQNTDCETPRVPRRPDHVEDTAGLRLPDVYFSSICSGDRNEWSFRDNPVVSHFNAERTWNELSK